MPWWRRRVPVARAALMPVLVSSLLSLTGPLAEGRWLLATALAGRIGAEVLVLALLLTGVAVVVDLVWQP